MGLSNDDGGLLLIFFQNISQRLQIIGRGALESLW